MASAVCCCYKSGDKLEVVIERDCSGVDIKSDSESWVKSRPIPLPHIDDISAKSSRWPNILEIEFKKNILTYAT